MNQLAAAAERSAMIDEYEREQLEYATQQLTHWDTNTSRQVACVLLSMVWLSVGGVTIFPVGLIVASMLLLPDMPAWSLFRRIRFTGKRVWMLVGCAIFGLLFARARIGLFDPSGSLFALKLNFGILPW